MLYKNVVLPRKMEIETCIQGLNNTLKNKTQEPSKNDDVILHKSSGQEVHIDTTVNTICSEEGC